MMSCTAKMALRSNNMLGPPLGSTKNNLPIFIHCSNLLTSGKNQSIGESLLAARVACSAVQETFPSATATETKEVLKAKKEAAPPAASKRAPPAQAPAKPLPQLMEDVIPSLKATLRAQEDPSNIELTFQDNKFHICTRIKQLEGSFLQNGIPYYFWAFFPNGNLTGTKGFSLSSYGSGASTVEPFLIDEKKITAKHVVFLVEKRLAAERILPVWKE